MDSLPLNTVPVEESTYARRDRRRKETSWEDGGTEEVKTDSTFKIVNYIILEAFYILRFATLKEAAFVTSTISTGFIVQCMLYSCYFCNKARTLLTTSGRVSCYAADSVSWMDCFTGLVNPCGVASRLNGVDR